MLDKKRGIKEILPDAINPYRWIMEARNLMFDKGIMESRSFSVPTICVGNISVGGTGKTPHTEYLIELLRKNHKVAMLSRGYGRKSKGYVKATHDSQMPIIGDEPFQIKNKFPDIDVAVCEKRVAGIERLMAENREIDVILLDDAYQHRHVKAGLYILLIDCNLPVWQDRVLPFGRLRESIGGIRRSDIVIMTKCDGITPEQQEWCRSYITEWKDIPVFFSKMEYGDCRPLFKECTALPDAGEILLVTGIANPTPLRQEIERRGARATMMQFGDHHNFTTGDFEKVAEKFLAMESRSKAIITTEKDATRLMQRDDLPEVIKQNIFALPIKVGFIGGEEKMFNQIIENYVTEDSRNS